MALVCLCLPLFEACGLGTSSMPHQRYLGQLCSLPQNGVRSINPVTQGSSMMCLVKCAVCHWRWGSACAPSDLVLGGNHTRVVSDDHQDVGMQSKVGQGQRDKVTCIFGPVIFARAPSGNMPWNVDLYTDLQWLILQAPIAMLYIQWNNSFVCMTEKYRDQSTSCKTSSGIQTTANPTIVSQRMKPMQTLHFFVVFMLPQNLPHATPPRPPCESCSIQGSMIQCCRYSSQCKKNILLPQTCSICRHDASWLIMRLWT